MNTKNFKTSKRMRELANLITIHVYSLNNMNPGSYYYDGDDG